MICAERRPWRRPLRLATAWLFASALGASHGGCAGPTEDGSGGSSGGFEGGSGAVGGAGGGGVDPELGGPCSADDQCDDGIECTSDGCDLDLGRCRFDRRDERCDDGIFCNGPEACHHALGCVLGEPASCEDGQPCTIDQCVEASQACVHVPRDADGDGDPDWHCGGGDCDESNPEISGTAEEVCANGQDDDCDGDADESDCASPMYDTCSDALLLTPPSSVEVTTYGASGNYATSCRPEDDPQDIVLAIELPDEPADVAVRATSDVPVALALAEQCGDGSSVFACGPSFERSGGGHVSKLLAHSVFLENGVVPLYVTTESGGEVRVEVELLDGSEAPSNETCGTATDVEVDATFEASVIGPDKDLLSACETPQGELVYRFVLAEPRDLDVYSVSLDGDGEPAISLRNEACALQTDEIRCSTGPNVHLFERALPAGTYFLSVSASAPTDVSVSISTTLPTVAPPEDACDTAPPIAPGSELLLPFDDHADDVTTCLEGALDVAFDVTLEAPSDVLLLSRLSLFDVGALALMDASCVAPVACTSSGNGPIRLRRRGVPPGSYRAVIESQAGSVQAFTALVRDAAPTSLVPFSDDCDDAIDIPESGGFFQGNTGNATADFTAGCDAAGGGPGGAKDQLLRLELPSPKRVVIDSMGSAYKVLLDVRRGPSCPGAEVLLGCSATLNEQDPALLDLDLEAGVYYIQVDGLGSAAGPWSLDVYVEDP